MPPFTAIKQLVKPTNHAVQGTHRARRVPPAWAFIEPDPFRAFLLSSPADSYSRHVNDPEVLAQTYEGFATRIVWASILHPFDFLATRMMTESAPEVRLRVVDVVAFMCECPLIA